MRRCEELKTLTKAGLHLAGEGFPSFFRVEMDEQQRQDRTYEVRNDTHRHQEGLQVCYH